MCTIFYILYLFFFFTGSMRTNSAAGFCYENCEIWLLIKPGLRVISNKCKITDSLHNGWDVPQMFGLLTVAGTWKLTTTCMFLSDAVWVFFAFGDLISLIVAVSWLVCSSWALLRWRGSEVKCTSVSRVTGFLQHLQWMSDSGALCKVEWILSAFSLASLW